MKTINIALLVNEKLETAPLICDSKKRTIAFSLPNALGKIYSAEDLYACLGLLRADFPNIKFLCKGAKLNVHPSRMSSQMSAGNLAYEMTIGRSAGKEDIVNIFDYEDTDITNNIEDQRTFYRQWIESLSK